MKRPRCWYVGSGPVTQMPDSIGGMGQEVSAPSWHPSIPCQWGWQRTQLSLGQGWGATSPKQASRTAAPVEAKARGRPSAVSEAIRKVAPSIHVVSSAWSSLEGEVGTACKLHIIPSDQGTLGKQPLAARFCLTAARAFAKMKAKQAVLESAHHAIPFSCPGRPTPMKRPCILGAREPWPCWVCRPFPCSFTTPPVLCTHPGCHHVGMLHWQQSGW